MLPGIGQEPVIGRLKEVKEGEMLQGIGQGPRIGQGRCNVTRNRTRTVKCYQE